MKKITGLIIDLIMYAVLLAQMFYVVVKNDVHEWLGIVFFVCLVLHMYKKRYWFTAVLKRKNRGRNARTAADVMIIALLVILAVLFLSSMGVSRTLFPSVALMNDPDLHRILAALALTISLLHGCMHGWFTSEKKKALFITMVLFTALNLGLGFGLVPWMNRHLRIVEVNYQDMVSGEKLEVQSKKPLAVYFTRVGNTDFEEDVDAVSGASLLLADGEMMGHTQVMADMVQDIIGCDKAAIELTGELYPSSYGDTVKVGGIELKRQLRPAIREIDVSEYDEIILIYPLWWGTVPMPVSTFLESQNFAGKTVWLLATQGSSGFGSSTKDVKKLIPDADVKEAISIYCEDIPECREMILEWMKNHRN